MHSQIYSGLSLIFAILRNFRLAGENESIRARLVRPTGANEFILAHWANIVFILFNRYKKNHFMTSF